MKHAKLQSPSAPVKIGMIAFLALWMTAGSAMAGMRFGVRAGATADPDQFHFGGHVITDPILPNFTFRPNLEIGLGSNITGAAANLEFVYSVPVRNRNFSIYAGAGPSLLIYRFGDSFPGNRDTDVGGGFNILFGIEHANGLMGEFKVGTIDSPDIKITIGYTFP